jgi:predicted secreted protein
LCRVLRFNKSALGNRIGGGGRGRESLRTRQIKKSKLYQIAEEDGPKAVDASKKKKPHAKKTKRGVDIRRSHLFLPSPPFPPAPEMNSGGYIPFSYSVMQTQDATLCQLGPMGCATVQRPQQSFNTSAAESDDSSMGSVATQVGRTFEVNLKQNGATGYQWKLLTPLDKGSPIELVDTRTVPSPGALVGMPGAGGTIRWTFRAVQSGEATLAFANSRPWEKTLPPAAEAVFHIDIHP